MIEWLKKYGLVVGLLAAGVTGTGTLIASAGSVVDYVDGYIESRVDSKLDKLKFAMSQEVQKDLQSVQRGLRGVQEQVNSGAADSKAIKGKIEELDRRQKNSRTASPQLRLNTLPASAAMHGGTSRCTCS